MKWTKASDRLPDVKGFYITKRPALNEKEFIVAEEVFNPKYADIPEKWISFEYQWLDETEPQPKHGDVDVNELADRYAESESKIYVELHPFHSNFPTDAAERLMDMFRVQSKKDFIAGYNAASLPDNQVDVWISVDKKPSFKPMKVGEKDAQTENLLLTDGNLVGIGFATKYFLSPEIVWQMYGNPNFEPTHYNKFTPLPPKSSK